jgi:methylated-DNA-protein-cysteine methyltransferase related protein
MALPSDSYKRIYAVVSRIPKGRVATYGQVAALARLPRQARLVGYAMHALPADGYPRGKPASSARRAPSREGSGTLPGFPRYVPWHRVVNAAGKISIRGDGLGHDELQAQLLGREGVRFVKDAIPLTRYRWKPRR